MAATSSIIFTESNVKPGNLIYIEMSSGTGVSDKVFTLFRHRVHQFSVAHVTSLYHCYIVGSSILNVDNEVGR